MSAALLPGLPAGVPVSASGQSGPAQPGANAGSGFDDAMQKTSTPNSPAFSSTGDDGDDVSGSAAQAGRWPSSGQTKGSTEKDKTTADDDTDDDGKDSKAHRKHSPQTDGGAVAIVMAPPAAALGSNDDDGQISAAGATTRSGAKAATDGKTDAADQSSAKAEQSAQVSALSGASGSGGQSPLAALRARLAQADAWRQSTPTDTASSATSDAKQVKAASDTAAASGVDQLATKSVSAQRGENDDADTATAGGTDDSSGEAKTGLQTGSTNAAKSLGKQSSAEDKAAQEHNLSAHDDKGTGTSKAPLSSATPTFGSSTLSSGQSRNSLSVASAITARPDWTQAITAAGQSTTGTGGQTVSSLTLQLNPANLGTVTATLHASGDHLAIHLQVQTAEAYRQLTTGNDAILDKLKGHGYAVEAITVQHVAAGQSSVQQTQQHAGFTTPQNGGGLARGGQQMAGQGQGRQGNGGQPQLFDQTASAGSSSAAVDAGGARADGVYI